MTVWYAAPPKWRSGHEQQRGPMMLDGKDRQQPVYDPYELSLDTLVGPQLWSNPGTFTWYEAAPWRETEG